MGSTPRKSLGQNFLFDLNLTGRIARAAGPLAGVAVVEVGPGPGGLTRALLAGGRGEGDRRSSATRAASPRSPRSPRIGRAGWRSSPATRCASTSRALATQAEGAPLRICANLPYNIATPLLVGWLEAEPWPPLFDRLTLMFQREVAERIVATPAERADYGRLAVLAGWRCQARILFDVPPAAFIAAAESDLERRRA